MDEAYLAAGQLFVRVFGEVGLDLLQSLIEVSTKGTRRFRQRGASQLLVHAFTQVKLLVFSVSQGFRHGGGGRFRKKGTSQLFVRASVDVELLIRMSVFARSFTKGTGRLGSRGHVSCSSESPWKPYSFYIVFVIYQVGVLMKGRCVFGSGERDNFLLVSRWKSNSFYYFVLRYRL